MTAVTKIRTDEIALRKARMLIGGKWVDSASGEVLQVEDPAHRRAIAEVPRGGAEDVARAVQAAADAFPAWSRTVLASAGAFSRGLPMRLRRGSRSWLTRLRSRPGTRFAPRHALRQIPQSTSSATSAAWAANSRAKRSPSASMF